MVSLRTTTTLIPVPPALARDVESIQVIDYASDHGVAIPVVPGGVPGIVFQHINGHPAIDHIQLATGKRSAIPTAFVYGPGMRSSVMHYKSGVYATTHVTFKPHAISTLLRVDAATLTDGYVELDMFAGGDLNARLLETDDKHQRARLLTDFLIAQLEQLKSRDSLVEASLSLIQQRTASISVNALIKQLHISERQFERRFRRTVGLSPQAYIRLKRFHEAVRLIRARRYETLTDIAHVLHYHDQSHFIRDMRAFSGMTPKALLQAPLRAETSFDMEQPSRDPVEA